MQHQEASIILNYTVSYLSLEMEDVKFFKNVSSNPAISFLKAISPDTSYFLYLYKEVGRKYEWTDWLRSEKSKLESFLTCLLYTSPSPRDDQTSRMPSSA